MTTLRNCLSPPPNSHHLPVKIKGIVERRDLVAGGWQFIDRCRADHDWWHARPPVGWKEASVSDLDSSVVSVFEDQHGRKRIEVTIPRNSQPTPYLEVLPFISFRAINNLYPGTATVRVMGGGKVLNTFQQAIDQSDKSKDAARTALMALAASWCDEYFPGWQDPTLFWE